MNDEEKFARDDLIIKYSKVMEDIQSNNRGFEIGGFHLLLISYILLPCVVNILTATP